MYRRMFVFVYVFILIVRYDGEGEREVGDKTFPRRVPFITVAIRPKHSKEENDHLIYVTCLHLNYRDENTRLKEINSIKQKLDKFIPAINQTKGCHIWTGDFNALTKEDYTDEEWQDIAKIRCQNSWESPKVDLIKKV